MIEPFKRRYINVQPCDWILRLQIITWACYNLANLAILYINASVFDHTELISAFELMIVSGLGTVTMLLLFRWMCKKKKRHTEHWIARQMDNNKKV